MRPSAEEALDAVAEVVRQIPPGKVASYGQVAELVPFPATARQVGRYMFMLEGEVPWWRVVGADGGMPVGRRDPRLGQEQAARLAQEGVEVPGGRVPRRFFWAV